MSEVTSVNSKTGEVVLKAADVEAIPTAQAGVASGVATLDSGTKLTGAQIPSSVATKAEVSTEQGRAEAAEALKVPLSQKGAKGGVAELNEESELPEAQLPGSVETNKVIALGSITGLHSVSFAESGTFTGTLTGATEIEPTGLPTGEKARRYLLKVKLEGHTLTIKGVTWIGPEPTVVGEYAISLFAIEGSLFAYVGVEQKVTWAGAYAAGTTYTPGQITGSNGSTYICVKETKGNEPPNATYWALFAEKGTLGVEQVAGENIKKETLENKHYKANSIGASKVEAAKALHAKGAEGTAEGNELSVTKKKVFTLNGNAAKTAWKLKHNLETHALHVTVQNASGEEPSKIETLAGFAEVKAIGASEIEVIFSSAPGAGVLYFITIIG